MSDEYVWIPLDFNFSPGINEFSNESIDTKPDFDATGISFFPPSEVQIPSINPVIVSQETSSFNFVLKNWDSDQKFCQDDVSGQFGEGFGGYSGFNFTPLGSELDSNDPTHHENWSSIFGPVQPFTGKVLCHLDSLHPNELDNIIGFIEINEVMFASFSARTIKIWNIKTGDLKCTFHVPSNLTLHAGCVGTVNPLSIFLLFSFAMIEVEEERRVFVVFEWKDPFDHFIWRLIDEDILKQSTLLKLESNGYRNGYEKLIFYSSQCVFVISYTSLGFGRVDWECHVTKISETGKQTLYTILSHERASYDNVKFIGDRIYIQVCPTMIQILSSSSPTFQIELHQVCEISKGGCGFISDRRSDGKLDPYARVYAVFGHGLISYAFRDSDLCILGGGPPRGQYPHIFENLVPDPLRIWVYDTNLLLKESYLLRVDISYFEATKYQT